MSVCTATPDDTVAAAAPARRSGGGRVCLSRRARRTGRHTHHRRPCTGRRRCGGLVHLGGLRGASLTLARRCLPRKSAVVSLASLRVRPFRGVGVCVWQGGSRQRPEGGGGGGRGSAPTDGTLCGQGKGEDERRWGVEAGRLDKNREPKGGREDKARRPVRGAENKARGRAGGRVDDTKQPAGRRVLEIRGPAGGFWKRKSGADATPLSPLRFSVAVDLLNALHDVDVDHVPPTIL